MHQLKEMHYHFRPRPRPSCPRPQKIVLRPRPSCPRPQKIVLRPRPILRTYTSLGHTTCWNVRTMMQCPLLLVMVWNDLTSTTDILVGVLPTSESRCQLFSFRSHPSKSLWSLSFDRSTGF